MSYQEEVIATVKKVLEYRILTVPTGNPAPTPAAGYEMYGPVTVNVVGLDLYIENRVKEVAV